MKIIIAITLLILGTTVPVAQTSATDTQKEIIMNELNDTESAVELTEDEVISAMLKKTYDNNSQYEIAGVLYVEDFIFDIVMKPTADDYYLYKTRDDEDKSEGELFMSQASAHELTQGSLDMTRIYGHKMATGRKFGQLYKMLYAENNRPLYFYDGITTKKFKLAKGFEFIDGTEKFERTDLTGSDKIEFLNRISENSIVSHENFNNITDEEILFLQTCVSAYGLDRHVFIFIEEAVL